MNDSDCVYGCYGIDSIVGIGNTSTLETHQSIPITSVKDMAMINESNVAIVTDSIHILSTQDLSKVTSIELSMDCISIQPNSTYCVCGNSKGQLSLFDVNGYISSKICECPLINDICWFQQNSIVVASIGHVALFDKRLESLCQSMYLDSLSTIHCVDVQSNLIVCGDEDGNITLFDWRMNQPLDSFNVHSSDVWNVVCHPSIQGRVMSVGEDGYLGFIDVNEKNVSLNDYFTNSLGINSIDYNVNTDSIVCGCDSNCVFVIK